MLSMNMTSIIACRGALAHHGEVDVLKGWVETPSRCP
jgi:hypothetical protein